MENNFMYTVSVYIVYANKVLLHKHKKHDILLPIGGHIEINETPEEACKREAKEETGLDIKIVDVKSKFTKVHLKNDDREEILQPPLYVLKCKIDSEHFYIDHVYYALAYTDKISPEKNETDKVFWSTKEELINNDKVTDNVKKMAIEALEVIYEHSQTDYQ